MQHASVSVMNGAKDIFLLLVVVPLLLTSAALAADVPDHEFTDLRVKWRACLIGTTDYDHNDPDIRAAIHTMDTLVVDENNTGFWDTMSKDASRRYLWADAADKAKSAHMTTSYRRLKAMALAYSTEASSLYLNAQLKQDVVSALDWMYSNRYNEREKEVDNWWDWEIGTPQLLNDITTMLYDELSVMQCKNYMRAVRHFVPDPTVRTVDNTLNETGANRSDKAFVCVIAGIIDKSSETIFKGQAAVSQIFLYVDNGDGFYQDGSFIQHTYVAYTGGYGSVLIDGISNIVSALGDSRWRITDPNLQNVYRWVRESIAPFIYRGAMMDNVRGRAISRFQSEDHFSGRQDIISITRLSNVAESLHELEYLKRVVKRWVTEDTTFASYYAGLDIVDAIGLKAIMGDPSISLEDELLMSRVYPAMARAVHRQRSYGFAVSMFSPRITAFEYGNGENLKGWYTGIGMTYLYDNDLRQFSEDYWATVDMYRLPGTTTDGIPSARLVDWHLYANVRTWVGGASLGDQCGAVGMDFDLFHVTGSSLRGRKSWFMFPDAIVCVGSGITGTDGRDIETIVENRRLRGGGAERVLTINGVKMDPYLGEIREAAGVRFAHLSGADAMSDIGYYFPSEVTLKTLRSVRTGSWSDVNKGGSTATLNNTFLTIALPHGEDPEDVTYAYVVLPGKTAAQVEAYLEIPPVDVRANTESVHAAAIKELGITAVNFWGPGSVSFIQAYQPLSIIVKEDKARGILHVVLCDPTEAQDSISVHLVKEGYTVASADGNTSDVMDSSMIRIEVSVVGAQGSIFHIDFEKS